VDGGSFVPGVALHKKSGIPPTEVGGLFKSYLQKLNVEILGNPTNGSWWMFQIQPSLILITLILAGIFKSLWMRRPDLNNPPTDVGGDSWFGHYNSVGRI
jgi:hypothetical protein